MLYMDLYLTHGAFLGDLPKSLDLGLIFSSSSAIQINLAFAFEAVQGHLIWYQTHCHPKAFSTRDGAGMPWPSGAAELGLQ